MRFAKQLYPYPLQPVDLIVEQHLSVGQVNVAVVGIVQQMPEQGEVVPGVLGSFLGCALVAKYSLEFGFCSFIKSKLAWKVQWGKKDPQNNTFKTKTYTKHSEEEGDEEQEGSMAHATPGCHQEELLLGHLTNGPITEKKTTTQYRDIQDAT